MEEGKEAGRGSSSVAKRSFYVIVRTRAEYPYDKQVAESMKALDLGRKPASKECAEVHRG